MEGEVATAPTDGYNVEEEGMGAAIEASSFATTAKIGRNSVRVRISQRKVT